jgi:hypothetical protein
MKHYLSLFLLLLIGQVEAQQIYRLYDGPAPGSENWNFEEQRNLDKDGNLLSFTDVVNPEIQVFLPSAEKSTGTAVVVLPGGGMRQLFVGRGFMHIPDWLNAEGIAVIFLKYRLNSDKIPGEFNDPPFSMENMPRVQVHEFEKFKKANANPAPGEKGDMVATMAGDDLKKAIQMIRKNSADWQIDPAKVGVMGFSAGGGVILNSITRPKHLPDFIASIYGPALNEVVVPKPAMPLFVAVEADHMNVAAGCLGLFKEWKAAGGSAELHVYAEGGGPFPFDGNDNTSDSWKESFLLWLTHLGF